MEGREEEWQMNVYLLHPQRLSLFPASLFRIALHVVGFAETAVA